MNIKKKLPKKFNSYKIQKLESGASKKKLYRLVDNNKSLILSDFSFNKNEYFDHIKIYNLLKKIDISIPEIFERYDNELIMISEDLGNLRFDKILNKFYIKDILNYALDSLIVINNSIKYENDLKLVKYDFNNLKTEISELSEYYFPYINNKKLDLLDEFLFIWSEIFKNINFEFNSFAHKDFNMNNLIYLPSKKNHLKCGIIDFQSAFWGHDSWDLFSLLEDSRILYTDEFNEYFIKYFHSNINSFNTLENFKIQYNFLNASRQTRLLGRWVKLATEQNNNFYLKFIPITLARLKKSIKLVNNKNLNRFYNKYVFINK